MCRRCQFRWFYSKGAALVLVWIFLATVTHMLLFLFINFLVEEEAFSTTAKVGLHGIVILSFPLFGWLADAKLGNYRVVKIGFALSMIVASLNCVYFLVYFNTSLRNSKLAEFNVVFLVTLIVLHGFSACTIAVNFVQLGLDQVPDGSAENISSLISWMVLTFFAGVWIAGTVRDLILVCSPNNSFEIIYQILVLLPVLSASISLVLCYILSPKWLIIEPKTPQSLKNIFRVLKFAAKHKAPLNRSAFTYWEEDVPSRLDLGKSRFGGPFTTEQVEDVKTIFRLSALSIPFSLVLFGLGIHTIGLYSLKDEKIPGLPMCKSNAVYVFTFDPWWCSLAATVVYELVIYPCINLRMPSLKKRMGFTAFAALLLNVIYMLLSVLWYFGFIDIHSLWIVRVNSAVYGIMMVAVLLPTLEFVCAQSPYNMRGLLIGCTQLIYWVTRAVADVLNRGFNSICKESYCVLVSSCIATAVSLIAFVLYLIVARWYKMRVRDNEYPAQAVVEEVYDRYLSHPSAAGQRPTCN